MFRDVTTLFADPRGFRMAIDQMLHPYAGVAIEQRRLVQTMNEERSGRLKAERRQAEFISMVSHELRTPLNAIIGYSEMLHDELGDKGEVNREQFQQDLGTITNSGGRLLTLIDDIRLLQNLTDYRANLVYFCSNNCNLCFSR